MHAMKPCCALQVANTQGRLPAAGPEAPLSPPRPLMSDRVPRPIVPHLQFGIPALPAVRAALAMLLRPASPRTLPQTGVGAEAVGGAGGAMWHPAAEVVHGQRLSVAALNLAAALRVNGCALLVGAPGAGKSLTWKALSGALVPGGTNSMLQPVAHVFPEALPLPSAVLAGVGGGGGEAGVAHWLQSVLAASRQQAGVWKAGLDAQQQLPWLIVDGPFGTLAAEIMMPLLLTRSKQVGSAATQVGALHSDPQAGRHGRHHGPFGPAGGRKRDAEGEGELVGALGRDGHLAAHAVLGLQDRTKVVWECTDLRGTSPALLAVAPVVCVGSPVIDLEAVVAGVVSRGVAGILPAVPDAAKARLAAAVSRPLLILWQDALSRLTPLLVGKSGVAVGRASPTPPPPSASASASVGGSEGVEHGDVLLGCALRTAAALFEEVVKGLDLYPVDVTRANPTPPGANALATVLGRASLFGLYWAFAGLPLTATARHEVRGGMGKEGRKPRECCGYGMVGWSL